MKKRLFFMSNQKGFFLPYVLFLSTLVLIIVTSSINIYKQEIRITENHLHQIKMETLVQMGRFAFLEEIENHQENKGEVGYTFPDGNVTISYTKLNEFEYNLLFTIDTNEKIKYVIIHYLTIANNSIKGV